MLCTADLRYQVLFPRISVVPVQRSYAPVWAGYMHLFGLVRFVALRIYAASLPMIRLVAIFVFWHVCVVWALLECSTGFLAMRASSRLVLVRNSRLRPSKNCFGCFERVCQVDHTKYGRLAEGRPTILWASLGYDLPWDHPAVPSF